MKTLVTTTHLEMTSRAELRPARPGATPFQLVRAEIPCPEFNRFLYTAVGWGWWWYSRLPWDYARWCAYLERPELETWVAYASGTPAGYFELERRSDDNVELAYFGVMPRFIGKGFGSALLSAAIERAWDMGARRVWVHTCSLDHPRALPNYKARGFVSSSWKKNSRTCRTSLSSPGRVRTRRESSRLPPASHQVEARAMGDMIALLLIGGLAVIPLAWRARRDRLEESALQVRAEVQATANRTLGGESLLTVAVTPPSFRRAGQVRLSAPAGWECLIETVWPRIMAIVPEHYELVVESHGPAMRDHRPALSAA